MIIMNDREATQRAKECLRKDRRFKAITNLNLIKVEKLELKGGRWKFILSFYLENKSEKYQVEIGDKTGRCLKFQPIH